MKKEAMKVRELIEKGVIDWNDVYDFIIGYEGFESVQQALNDATGFKKAIFDIDITQDSQDSQILEAEIIEGI